MGKKLGEDGLNALISLVKGQTVEEFSLAEISSLWNGATYSTQTVETYTVYEGYKVSETLSSASESYALTNLVAERKENYESGYFTSDENITFSFEGATTNYNEWDMPIIANTGIKVSSESGIRPSTMETYEFYVTQVANNIPLVSVETASTYGLVYNEQDTLVEYNNIGISTVSSGEYSTTSFRPLNPYRSASSSDSFTNWYSVSYSYNATTYTVSRSSCTTTDPSALYYIVSSTTSTR